jgi:hypothetical protein
LFHTTSANGTYLWVERSRFRPRAKAWAIHLNNQDGKIVAYCERHSDVMETIRNWNDMQVRIAARIARAKEMGDL